MLVDFNRAGRATNYGFVVLGPFLGIWYPYVLPWLSKMTTNTLKVGNIMMKGRNMTTILVMVFWDQVVESVYADGSYLYSIRFMEKMQDALAPLKEEANSMIAKSQKI